MCETVSYKNKSFLFTIIFTFVVILGYMAAYSLINSFDLKCWPFFVVTMVLMLIKFIIVSNKGKWKFQEIISELEIFVFSATLFIPLGLTYLFSADIKTEHLPIIVNYLIFIPGNLVLYFCYLGIKTLHYRLTGKTIYDKK